MGKEYDSGHKDGYGDGYPKGFKYGWNKGYTACVEDFKGRNKEILKQFNKTYKDAENTMNEMNNERE